MENKPPPYTFDEDKTIERMFADKCNDATIGLALNRTAIAIRSRRKKLGFVYRDMDRPNKQIGLTGSRKYEFRQEGPAICGKPEDYRKVCTLHLIDLMREYGSRREPLSVKKRRYQLLNELNVPEGYGPPVRFIANPYASPLSACGSPAADCAG